MHLAPTQIRLRMTQTTRESFQSLHQAAMRLGVPAAWLRTEAKACRVPYLRAGRRLLFNVALVEDVLKDRARREAKNSTDD